MYYIRATWWARSWQRFSDAVLLDRLRSVLELMGVNGETGYAAMYSRAIVTCQNIDVLLMKRLLVLK